MAEMFYLQNLQAGYMGNSPMFWAKGGNGYTQWLDNCELFTEVEVNRHVASDTKKWRAWPAAKVDSLARRTVDIQDLRK